MSGIAELKDAILVPEAEFEAFLLKFGWDWQQVARGEYPAGFETLEELQLAAICADPYLWCQMFLREQTDPEHKEPYSFFSYQVEGIRHMDDAVFYCAAEVGKTRDIIATALYIAFNNPGGSGLIAAPQQVHLDEIISAMEDQFSWNTELGLSVKQHIKAPHHLIVLNNDFKIYFRPAGHDGEAFRGVHVRDFIIVDEGAKMCNKKQWSELWRAGLPSCKARIYSVPDGRRDTEFFRLGQLAKGTDADVQISAEAGKRNWRLFRWSKPMMPAPFWSDARRRDLIEKYGGEETPGYRQNVLGEDGDPVNSVFPWPQFSKTLKDVQGYKVLKMFADEAANEVSIFVASYTPVFKEGKANGAPEQMVLCDERVPLRGFDMRAVIKKHFSAMPGLYMCGADLGYSQDPTEIVVKFLFGKVHRLTARVQLKGVTYDLQDECLDALDDVFGFGGIGLDLGAAGSAVYHNMLSKYPGKRYEDRLTGYQFASTYEAVNEEGQGIMDKRTDKPLKKNAKELATDFLTARMQRQENEYPFDPDILLYYPNHTSQFRGEKLIYSKDNDHIIDADRVLTLQAVLPNIGLAYVDGCTSGQRMEYYENGIGAFLT